MNASINSGVSKSPLLYKWAVSIQGNALILSHALNHLWTYSSLCFIVNYVFSNAIIGFDPV